MQVIKDVKPDQQLVKVVYDEYPELIGSEKSDPNSPAKNASQVVPLAGLQGVGVKTTAAGKLAMFLKKQGKRVLHGVHRRVSSRCNRSVEMLATVDVSFLKLPATGSPPVATGQTRRSMMCFVDTAGRLQVDEGMMSELQEIQVRRLPPMSSAEPASIAVTTYQRWMPPAGLPRSQVTPELSMSCGYGIDSKSSHTYTRLSNRKGHSLQL
jgi:signal recognition particle GTPase